MNGGGREVQASREGAQMKGDEKYISCSFGTNFYGIRSAAICADMLQCESSDNKQ